MSIYMNRVIFCLYLTGLFPTEILLRSGITAAITAEDMDVVAEADNCKDALEMLMTCRPNVLIISDGFATTSGPGFHKRGKKRL